MMLFKVGDIVSMTHVVRPKWWQLWKKPVNVIKCYRATVTGEK